MARGKARFQAADVARAIKGATAAGKSVAKVVIGRDGEMVGVIGKPGDHTEANEWDAEFDGKDPIKARKCIPQQKSEGR
jgi:hypothetical protein